MNKKDLAKRWNVSERTINRWMIEKNLPFRRIPINNRVIFDEEEIEKWEKEMLHGKKD